MSAQEQIAGEVLSLKQRVGDLERLMGIVSTENDALKAELARLMPLAYETRPGMEAPPVTWQEHSQDILRKLYAEQEDAARLRAALEALLLACECADVCSVSEDTLDKARQALAPGTEENKS